MEHAGTTLIDAVFAAIVNEGQWLAMSMSLAVMLVAAMLYQYRHADIPARRLTLAAMNLFAGVTVGTMAFGHLLAVTTKRLAGMLTGSLLVFYLIGGVLAAPAWWLVTHTWRILARGHEDRPTIWLNAWLAATLLALGLHNLPLAAPAILNVAYVLHTRRAVGMALVGVAIVLNLGLFAGALVFWASGQSFEQFRGIDLP
jgi:hypothetical protein